MEKQVFVDTGGWVALINEEDEYHDRVVEWMDSNEKQLCTTTFVIDESITFLKYNLKQNAHQLAVAFAKSIRDSNLTITYNINDEDWDRALEIFEQYADQDFSFTDCTSFAIMERMKLREALAFDSHFQTLGITLVA